MTAETLKELLEYFDLKQFFADNSPLRLAIIVGIMCAAAVAAHFLSILAQKKLEKFSAGKYVEKNGQAAVKPPADAMDFALFERLMRNIRRFLYISILWWGAEQLNVGPVYAEVERILFSVVLIWVMIILLTAFVPFNIDLYLRRRGMTIGTSQSRSLMPIINGVIWAIGLTFMLDNLGLHVSTIIAGLGIMGVAVGLAGQAILADFFSYIVILLDKPFRIGDFVEIGDGKSGSVEYMGPKTVHLRSLCDDLIVCANAEMTKGVLVNQGSIHEREVIVSVGVAYDTPLEKIRRLPEIFRDVVNSFPQCSFDRACLLEFGPSNLLFQLMYFVSEQRGGIRAFMNTRSDVNMAILERFAAEDITMAFPTENVLLTNLDRRAKRAPADAGEAPDAGAAPESEKAPASAKTAANTAAKTAGAAESAGTWPQ